MDAEDAADASGADKFGGTDEAMVVFGALLAAGLEDAVVLADGLDHGPALVEALGEGFFAVDVLAGAGGVEDLVDVPVVGGADDDGVDGVEGEDVVVVNGG